MTVHSPLASPSATQAVLKQWGLATKKSLGQHFLIDDGVVGRILSLAQVAANDVILEVGPGIGTLTLALLQQGATVIAIEKDKNLLPVLADSTAPYKPALTLIQADALEALPTSSPHKLVANLPYAVAATIVLDYFERFNSLQSATVMVQKEVAARMMAQPGTKDYGAYTIKLQLLAHPTGSFTVAPSNFLPPPRVDSTVIRLDRHTKGAPHRQPTIFVVDAAFAQRRKTIRNSMRAHFAQNGIDPNTADVLLEQARISPQVRGETLTVDQYRDLGTLFATM